MVNPKTRELITEAAERLGYRPHLPARSLMTGRTQTIVVIAADLGNPWVTPILHGVASRVAVDGIVPIIAETNNDSRVLAELIDHMLARGVDAIIVLAAQTPGRRGHRSRRADRSDGGGGPQPARRSRCRWSPTTIVGAARWSPSTSPTSATSWSPSSSARARS